MHRNIPRDVHTSLADDVEIADIIGAGRIGKKPISSSRLENGIRAGRDEDESDVPHWRPLDHPGVV